MATETTIAGGQENWFLLMDPQWVPEDDDDVPPIEAIVGVWPLEDDGEVGRFRANPSYQPTDENSPSDPLDAVLRRMIAREAEPEQLQLLLRDTFFDLAMNGDGRPLVVRSPDDVPCVAIATAERYRQSISSPDWRRVDLEDLVDLLADEIDVLFNPGGPASVRLVGDFVRAALMLTDEEVAAAYQQFLGDDDEGLHVLPWDLTDDGESDEPPNDDEPASDGTPSPAGGA